MAAGALVRALAACAALAGCLTTPSPDSDVDRACPSSTRDVCAPGPCIGEAGGGCAAEVCDSLPSCCDTAWTPTCAAMASMTCGQCRHAAVVGGHQRVYVTTSEGDWPVLWSLGAETGGPRLGSTQVAWGDHDVDGDADLALIGACDAAVFSNLGVPGAVSLAAPVWLDLDDGVVGCPPDYVDQFRGVAVAWGDVDRDGRLELAVGGARGLGLYRAIGSSWELTTLLGPDELAGPDDEILYLGWLDVDGDDWLDLIVGRFGPMVVWRNVEGVLTPPAAGAWQGPTEVARAATCDVDRDLDEDLIVVDGAGTLGVLQPGAGGFAMTTQVDADARAVACADLDGDSIPELLSVDRVEAEPQTAGRLRVWRRASASEAFGQIWASGELHFGLDTVALADHEGDGDLDVLIPTPGAAPGFDGAWFHLYENQTVPLQAIELVARPGRYLADVAGVRSWGVSWMPLTPRP